MMGSRQCAHIAFLLLVATGAAAAAAAPLSVFRMRGDGLFNASDSEALGSAPGSRLQRGDEAHTRTVISVADYGAIADSDADSCLAFNKSIEAARAQNASVLRIPRGTYNFWHNVCTHVLMYVSNTVSTPLPPKPIALWLRGLTGPARS
jgi:polygalacturonase